MTRVVVCNGRVSICKNKDNLTKKKTKVTRNAIRDKDASDYITISGEAQRGDVSDHRIPTL